MVHDGLRRLPYNHRMTLMRRFIALAVSLTLGAMPAFAQVQSVRVSIPSASGVSGAIGSHMGVSPMGTPVFGAIPSMPSASLGPTPSAPVVLPAALVSLSAAPSVAVAQSVSISAHPAAAALTAVQSAAANAIEGLAQASGDASSAKGAAQFSALTAEPLRSASSSDDSLVPSAGKPGSLPSPSGLAKPAPASDKAEPTAPRKPGVMSVFKDPERNKAFWRYATGYSLFIFVYEMYIVGMPYLSSSITRNSLSENKDARLANDEAIKALIRSNRSLARIAHWIAQAFSYATIPLFTRDVERDGPRKWLVRSMLIRAGVLAAVPALFFATGLFSVQASLYLLLGLIAAQSFFQGISVTSEGAATTRILGDPSVTSEERTKANSVLTFIVAIFSIIAPAVAGQIALIGPVMGKTGVGGAVIYGIYAGGIAIAGLVYASIRMIGGPGKAAATAPTAAPQGLGGTLKSLWLSIKDGTRLVFKDRFLRTLLIMSMVTSLFSDPLIFNVLPEYIEDLVSKNPDSVGAIMSVPGLGWFLKSLTATPMGNFAMMMVMVSVGSIIATFLIKPLTRLFRRLGFKTDEALTIPFYVLAALEAPLFIVMIHTPTVLGAVVWKGVNDVLLGELPDGWEGPFVVGTLAATGSGLLAIRGLLGYVRRHDYSVFVVYRLLAAAVILLLIATGVRAATF